MKNTQFKSQSRKQSRKQSKKITFEVIHRSEPSKRFKVKASMASYHTVHNYISEMKGCGFIWVRPCM